MKNIRKFSLFRSLKNLCGQVFVMGKFFCVTFLNTILYDYMPANVAIGQLVRTMDMTMA